MSYYNGERIDDDFHPQEKETGIHDKGLSKYLYTERGFVKPEIKESFQNWPRGDDAIFEHDIVLKMKQDNAKWKSHLVNLPTIPAADTSKFIVGNWYEEGKDFVLEKEETGVERKIYACLVEPSQGLSEEDKGKEMQELERTELRKEAEKVYGDDPNNWGGQRDGYVNGVIAERSRNINLAAQLLIAKQRIKELETELFSKNKS